MDCFLIILDNEIMDILEKSINHCIESVKGNSERASDAMDTNADELKALFG